MEKSGKEVLLKSFMKRNKIAREKMAKRAGYSSAEHYRIHLSNEVETIINKKTVTPRKAKKVVEAKEVQNALDMVIAFDTTGSMSSYISSVKAKVTEMVTDLFKNTTDLRIKVVAFGDYCDMKSATDFGKAYQVLELTNNVKDIIEFVKHAQNTSGGDGDEFYELVIKKITEESDWRADARKSVLLIGDAPPHKVGYRYEQIVTNAQIDWKIEAKKAADLGIQFDTFTIESYSAGWYQELSKITGGVSLPFKSSKNTSNIIEGLAYKRSGATASYSASVTTASVSGDSELIGAFKTISTIK